MCASIHRGREVQAQFFIYLSSSPSPLPRSTKKPESFKHLAGTQKEDSGLGFFSMLMTIEARRDWVTCASKNPFTESKCCSAISLPPYTNRTPRDRRATMLHPYSG